MSGERDAEGSSLPGIPVSARARVSAGTGLGLLAWTRGGGISSRLRGSHSPSPSQDGVCRPLRDFCCRGMRSPRLCLLPARSWLLLPQNVTAFRFQYFDDTLKAKAHGMG